MNINEEILELRSRKNKLHNVLDIDLKIAKLYEDLGEFDKAGYIYYRHKSYYKLSNIVEKIKFEELFDDALSLLLGQRYNFDSQAPFIASKVINLFYINRDLYHILMDKIKELMHRGEYIDYFTLLALDLAEKPNLDYIQSVFLIENNYATKRILSSAPFHKKNLDCFLAADAYRNHSSCVDRKAYEIIYLKKSNLVVPLNKKQLKIAFCISGQLRGFKEAWKSWSLFFKNSNHTYDIYCATWNKLGNKPFDLKTPERFFTKNFSKVLNEHLNHLGVDELKNKFNNLYQWYDDSLDTDYEEIEKLYKPTKLYIEDEKDFKNKSNMYNMHYMIEKSYSLIDNPNEYDIIVRIRPDKILEKFDIDWTDIYDIVKNNTLICDLKPFIHPNIGYTMGDQVAISIPRVMHKYSHTFSNTINKIGIYNSSMYSNFMPHASLFAGLIEDDVQVIALNEKIIFSPKTIDIKKIDALTLKKIIYNNVNLSKEEKLILTNALEMDTNA